MSEKKPKLVSLNYTKVNIVSFQLSVGQPLFILKPGINYVPQDIYDLMKKDSTIKAKFDCGDIDLVADAESDSPAEIYSSLKPKDKKVTIQASTSLEELESYLGEEKNKDLKDLIEKQIEAIQSTQFRDGTNADPSAQ